MGETFKLDDINVEGPNLDVPDPPPGTPYEDFEDYRTREILRANGIVPEEAGVLNTLTTRDGPLQAAAAHTAGSLRLESAVEPLSSLLGAVDHLVATEAAYALARIGKEAGRTRLLAALDGNTEVDLAPAVAAGYLVQLGDAAGEDVVRRSLGSGLDPVRMTACKQLYHFARFLGLSTTAGMFRQALADSSENIRWQAEVQLRMLGQDLPSEI
jgi:hypothetical protein